MSLNDIFNTEIPAWLWIVGPALMLAFFGSTAHDPKDYGDY